MQTPAMTASTDAKKFSRREKDRKAKIRTRADELTREAIISENLMELYARDPRAAMARYQVIQSDSYIRAAREVPVVTLTTEERQFTNRARHLRNNVRNWRSGGSDEFDRQLAVSADEIRAEIADGEALIDWFTKCIPSIAEFTGEEGKTSFTDDDVFRNGNVTVKKADAYASMLGGFNSFLSKWMDRVADYQDELDMYEDSPTGDVLAAVESLGLEQTFEDADDGCLWFKDPETEQLYYISLYHLSAHPDHGVCVRVSDQVTVRQDRSRRENWKDVWAADLTQTIISWGRLPFTPYHKVCEAYFGLYDGACRKWVTKSVNDGNTPPDFFPTHLTQAK